MQAQRSLILGLTLSLGYLGACGDDDKPADKPAPDAGTQPPKKDAGSTSKPTTITCGTNECTAPALGGGFLGTLLGSLGDTASAEVCCAGDAEDVCGVSQAFIAPGQCFEQSQEGKPNAACEGFALTGLPLSIPGCCKPTGQCGLDLSLLGVGCMERTEVSEVASSGALGSLLGSGALGDAGLNLGDAGIAPLEAVPCDYEAPSQTDAGADAGNDPGDAGSDAGTGDSDAGTDAG